MTTKIEDMGFSKPGTVKKLRAAGIKDFIDLATYNEARLRKEVGLTRPEIVEVKEVVIGSGIAPGTPREAVIEALKEAGR